jgi:HSP20 family molecular chaperone IbpA
MKNTTVQNSEKRGPIPTAEGTRSVTFAPRVDIMETEGELMLFVDVPGCRQDDVELRFEKGELILHCRCAPRHTEVNFIAQEYEVGDYYRVFTISDQIDSDKISASLHGGVLTVHLPKRESVKPRKISVKGA